MVIGDLIIIVQGGKLVSPWLGEPGVIIDKYNHPQSTKPDWFEVMLSDHKIKVFHQDYLRTAT